MGKHSKSKPDDKNEFEHLELDPPELEDNSAYFSDLKKEYQSMFCDGAFSKDQKNILIAMMLKI